MLPAHQLASNFSRWPNQSGGWTPLELSWKCAIVVADPIHKSQSFKICIRPVSGRDEGLLRCASSVHHVPIQRLRRCKTCFEDDDGGLAFLDQKPQDSFSRLNHLFRTVHRLPNGDHVRFTSQSVHCRSLAIRQVDAGSCNGCELEIAALNNPIHDIERFGIHFVASPRHADMLLVTGPVTRNMELALVKTHAATPDPKVVVAVGACGISGGIFGTNYATRGGVDAAIPVDVYIPGCPPRPEALLYGILLAVGRLAEKLR